MSETKKPIGEQVIVVFGATSGIGRATALSALRQGAKVVATGRDQQALESLAAEAATDSIATFAAEATDAGEVEAVAALAASAYGRIDTWAHVAGTAEYSRFEDMTPDEFRRVIEVDLLGPVWGARAALPHLRASRGALVVVSSEVAKRSFPLLTSYSAAKHGVNGFLEALRGELQHEKAGVAVTQIMPAAVATPFFEHARTRIGVRPSGPPPVYTPETVAKAILHAAEHGGRDVPVGMAAKTALAFQRISPTAMDFVSRAMAFRLQQSGQPKAPEGDALFKPPSGDDRVRGVVSNAHR
jgi:short-subunit dehydrogenase